MGSEGMTELEVPLLLLIGTRSANGMWILRFACRQAGSCSDGLAVFALCWLVVLISGSEVDRMLSFDAMRRFLQGTGKLMRESEFSEVSGAWQ